MVHVGLNDVGLNDVIQSFVRHIICAQGHLRYVGCRYQTHSKLKIKISIISLNITQIKFGQLKRVVFFPSNNTLMLACLACGLCMVLAFAFLS